MPGRWRVAREQTDASLSVVGDDLDPDEIAALMGCAPSRAERKGQVMFVRGGGKQPRVAQRGLWRLQASAAHSGDLEAQIMEVLALLPQDLALWRDLSARYKLSMFCGLFMQDWNEAVFLSPRVLLALAHRGIGFDLDIYWPADGDDAGDGA